ncbi:MAG: hypothetical protein KTR33_15965 [Gammaproteobacteria bacterium]|nr:hypothetical protein [Gammaproteobacteria bacterium]
MGSSDNSIQATAAAGIEASQPWLHSSLVYLTVAIAILVLARILIALARLFIRRRYNLTYAETASTKTPQAPSFLQVNSASRDALVARGATFDERMSAERNDSAAPAQTGETPETLDFYARISRFLSVIVAIVTLATSVVGAAASVELFDSVGQRFSGWDRFSELVRTHWIGAGIVALVILIEIYRFFGALRQPGRS